MRKQKGRLIKNSIKSGHKETTEALLFGDNASAVFYLFLPEGGSPGRTDLEQKSSADEREAYKGTLSEETGIK